MMEEKRNRALFLLLLHLFLPLSLFSQAEHEHDAVDPMPADSLSPWEIGRIAADSSKLHLSGRKGEFSYLALPYPMLMGGLERGYSSWDENEAFYSVGGGAGIRMAYDSSWALAIDAFQLTEKPAGYWGEALGAPDISPGYGLRQGKRVRRLSGHLQFRPSEHFTLRAGRGKHFFGNGHRSLLLSHTSDVYPYFRIDSEFGRFRYVNLYSSMQDLRGGSGQRRRERKYTAMHYLSFEASDRWSFGFFETVLWQGRDTMSPRGYELNYLNPVVLYRPLEYAQGSAGQVIMGLDVEYRAFRTLNIYLQGVLDEFLLEEIRAGDGWWGNKYGIQAGFHWEEAFTWPRLSWRVEFNAVRPFTYSHASPVQSYSHRGRPLAHPMGANFQEWLSILEWEKDPWRVRGEFMLSYYGADPSKVGPSYGRDLFRPYQERVKEYGNRIGQGDERQLIFAELEGSRMLDEASGLRAGLSLGARRNFPIHGGPSSILNAYQHYFRVFLRSSLFPRVRDF